jgi:hypothetical protein
LGYDEISAFGTFWGWNILEAKQVVTAFHLIGNGFLGNTVASAFLANHGNLLWNLNPKYFCKHVFRVWQLNPYYTESKYFCDHSVWT